jgi:hypothetical protein
MAEIIDFKRKKTALFTEEQKARLATSVGDLTDKPQLAVDRIEQDLCAQITENVREVTSVFAQRLGSKLARMIFGD